MNPKTSTVSLGLSVFRDNDEDLTDYRFAMTDAEEEVSQKLQSAMDKGTAYMSALLDEHPNWVNAPIYHDCYDIIMKFPLLLYAINTFNPTEMIELLLEHGACEQEFARLQGFPIPFASRDPDMRRGAGVDDEETLRDR